MPLGRITYHEKNITAGLVVSFVGAVALMAGGHAQALGLSGNIGGAASVSATSSANVGVDVSPTTTGTGDASGSVSAAAELLVSEPIPIMSSADLATYNDIVMKARPAVAAINVDNTNNTIAIQYSQPAKLFGIFPATLSGNVTVDAEGNTSVSLPWWSIFYVKDAAAVQASAAAAVAQSGASFDAQADASTKLQNEARVIDAVTGALQAQAVAAASTSVSTSASVE